METQSVQFSESQLRDYLERIGLTEEAKDPHTLLPPTIETLAKLQMRHSYEIPFDNLDMPLKLATVRVDPDSVHKKLIRGQRGGVCFEMNHCIMYALRCLGFHPVMHPAVVWVDNNWTSVASHVMNVVSVEGQKWLVDVGFGNSFVEFLPAVADVETTQFGINFKLTESCDDAGVTWFTLNRKYPHHTEWSVVLKVRMAPLTPRELEVAMDAVQNHMDFAKDHFVTRPTPEGGRISLLSGVHLGNAAGAPGCCLCIRSNSTAPREQRPVSEEEKAQVLKQHFAIVLPTK